MVAAGLQFATPETKPELAAQSAATTAGKAAPTTEVQKTAESTPAPPAAKSEPSPSQRTSHRNERRTTLRDLQNLVIP